jgi:hypothetical protein
MLEVSNRGKPAPDERKIVVLEFLAATVILTLTVIVLYMVFSYRPA